MANRYLGVFLQGSSIFRSKVHFKKSSNHFWVPTAMMSIIFLVTTKYPFACVTYRGNPNYCSFNHLYTTLKSLPAYLGSLET